jgi:hypothetical protein
MAAELIVTLGGAPHKGAVKKDPDPLAKVSTTESECASGTGEFCSSRKILSVVQQFIITKGTTVSDSDGSSVASQIIVAAAKLLDRDCTSEACVVSHPQVISSVQQSGGAGALGHKDEIIRMFKPAGPREGTALLSNFNLDDVVQRWAREFPHYFNCPFSMMDFEKEANSFGQIYLPLVFRGKVPQQIFSPEHPRKPEVVRRECTTFGCILNTDVSTGKGKHWVCVFVDMRGGAEEPWTIEYFNSAGNPPPRPITRWMGKVAQHLRDEFGSIEQPQQVDVVVVSDICHQKSMTECGVYTLYYTRSRLEGVPWANFTEWIVQDAPMTEFRTHLFSGIAE